MTLFGFPLAPASRVSRGRAVLDGPAQICPWAWRSWAAFHPRTSLRSSRSERSAYKAAQRLGKPASSQFGKKT
jgi:hypothetical protein